MKTIFVKPIDVKREWLVIDAEDKILGKVAEKAATLARGKHKAYYAPHQEMGDYIVIINAGKIRVSGKKLDDKLYYRHTGHPGGIKVEPLKTLLGRKPTAPLEKAIRGMLPKGPLGNKLYTNIKIYAGEEHPHMAQKPTAVEL